jgi:hypothetical protein
MFDLHDEWERIEEEVNRLPGAKASRHASDFPLPRLIFHFRSRSTSSEKISFVNRTFETLSGLSLWRGCEELSREIKAGP